MTSKKCVIMLELFYCRILKIMYKQAVWKSGIVDDDLAFFSFVINIDVISLEADILSFILCFYRKNLNFLIQPI